MIDASIQNKLQPYLPRLTLEWLATEPDRRHRAVDGSVVSVDVSGFTKLSEKLARFGRVGAEEMADAINECFTELLAVAYEQGGGLLKFGGDALLLLFTGGSPEEHAARAARAAAGMRRRLRTVGKLQTSGGRVDLRMSVGAHTGRFDFFLVGASHRELIVTGPATTTVVRMEGTAGPGEIVISPLMRGYLPADATGEAKGPGFVLSSAPKGSADPSAWVVPEVPDDLLSASVPMAIRGHLLAGAVEPEHRQVAVAFLHFDGTDELLLDEGPEVLAAELDRLVRDAQEAVDEHGVSFLGSDVDADGGKLILTAGAPRSMGEDEERMLLALRRIVEGDRRIAVRIGATRGGVFAGDIGPPYRRTYTVMGDTVNLAARLMAKAPPGEIYATAAIVERSGTHFDATAMEPFMVKGKAKPVEALSIGPPVAAGRRRIAEGDRLPLVGRQEEMAVLRQALASARAGEARLVEIVGEAGIGKTRLLRELRDLATDLVVTGATGEAFTASTPYVAWRDMLRELSGLGWDDPADVVVGRLGELVEAHEPSLRPWLPLIAVAADAEMPPTPEVADLAPEFIRPKLHEVVEAFLRATVRTPTLFAIEDAHLMDQASAELTTAIARGGEGRPWLFVVCRRPADAGFHAPEHPAIQLVAVPSLGHAAAVALAEAGTEQAPIGDHLLQDAVQRAAGNPQLLLDLLRTVASGEGALPESVEAAATVRIDSLPQQDRSLIRRASVFGLAFHPRLLDEVLDHAISRPDEGTWMRLAEFFEDEAGGYLRFRRAVIRDAAYAGLPFRTRRQLHAAVGRRMERESDDPEELAGLLAMHFSLAGEHEMALRYATVAAGRAREIFANVEAATQYARAIEAARRLDIPRGDLLDLLEALGEVLWHARLHRDALRVNADARALAKHDPVRLARLIMKRSMIEEMTGRLSQSLRWLTKARTLLADDGTAEAGRIVAELDARYASGLQAQGRNRETVAKATQAIEEGERFDSGTALGYAENVLGIALTTLGEPEAMVHFRRALGHFEDMGDLRGQAIVLSNMGVGEYFEGRWSEAVELYERAAQVSERFGDPVLSANQKMNVGEVLVDQGYPQEAEPLFREASRVWRATGEDYGLGFCLIQLGRVASISGRIEEALSLLHQARERYRFVGASGQMLEVDAREVECRLLTGEPDGALPRIEEIVARLEVAGGVNVLMPLLDRLRGYALAQLDRLDAANDAFEESVGRARERGAEHEVAFSLEGLARIARMRGEPSVEIEQEMGAIFERLGIGAVLAFPMTRLPNHLRPGRGKGAAGPLPSPIVVVRS